MEKQGIIAGELTNPEPGVKVASDATPSQLAEDGCARLARGAECACSNKPLRLVAEYDPVELVTNTEV